MSTAKETMAEILARQPDDSSYDALLRELAYARMVRRGLDDCDSGKVVSNQDARSELLPQLAVAEAVRRRDEMIADPNLGLTHDEVWKHIGNSRNEPLE